VHLQEPARDDLVEAAAEEVRVGDQALDARERLEVVQEYLGIQAPDESPRALAELGLELARELLLRARVELLPVDPVGVRELLEDRVENLRGKKSSMTTCGKGSAFA
jgi:hypothetical protein